MNRRQAIQGLATVSAGLLLAPACTLAPSTSGPVFENLSFTPAQQQLIGSLSAAILPQGDQPVSTPESTQEFILRMLNDCYSPEAIKRFSSGFIQWETATNAEYKKSFDRLSPEEQMVELAKLETAVKESGSSGQQTAPLPYFYQTIRQLTTQHFTSSQYFMTEQLDFEFIPARYIGCAAV